LFIGADGAVYEVKGEPDVVFNIITSPSIQINSRFMKVPDGYAQQGITETVLGDFGITACLGGKSEYISFSQNGTAAIGTRMLDFGPTVLSTDPPLTLTVYRYACKKGTGKLHCTWSTEPVSSTERDDLGVAKMEVEYGYGQEKVKLVVFNSFLEKSGSKKRNAHDLLVETMDKHSQLNRFYFTEVNILQLPKTEMHGLLGQRASKDRIQDTNSLLQVTGFNTGKMTALKQNRQGEGFIQGSYLDYKVEGNDIWGSSFVHNQFQCLSRVSSRSNASQPASQPRPRVVRDMFSAAWNSFSRIVSRTIA
jgi:hypothetical protein